MKKIIFFLFALSLGFLFLIIQKESAVESKKTTFWEFRSIDTMKYSRDVAREKLKDPSYDFIIDQQVKQIAETGATHVAIAVPYDEEFLPFMERWVATAREYNLNIWFRGNWSGWEGWFEYPKISRSEHIKKTEEFIRKHPNLFKDGDVFTACPECENGGTGDPRMNGDAEGHKKFLIDEYKVTKEAFKRIRKNVASNYHSMNGDVARLIMDRKTTKALDGLVVVDHYVATPEKLAKDIKEYAQQSGGKVILGEFGAPIPDIHGNMTEEEQARWLKEAFAKLILIEEFAGVNYWTGVGGSTELWNGDGVPRKAVQEITNIYRPHTVTITIKNEIEETLKTRWFPYSSSSYKKNIVIKGYEEKNIMIDGKDKTITLKKLNEDVLFRAKKFFKTMSK